VKIDPAEFDELPEPEELIANLKTVKIDVNGQM
jgi:hypothetical protein